jgi:hypothetical protein
MVENDVLLLIRHFQPEGIRSTTTLFRFLLWHKFRLCLI